MQLLIFADNIYMQGSPKKVENCECPKCFISDFGKGCHQRHKINTINNILMKEQDINKDHHLPVYMVSIYH